MPACTPRSAHKDQAKEAEPITETEKVHVAIRVRPLNKRERISKKPICLSVNDSTKQLSIVEGVKLELGEVPPFSDGPSEKISRTTFQFDNIFWSLKPSEENSGMSPATQEDVFNEIGIPLVNHAFRGFNSCLFAYGQTGSGKTYTMMGADVAVLEGNEGRGVAPRIFQEIFQRKSEIESTEGNASIWTVEVGYVEVYNERVSDLLAKRPKPGEEVFVEVREHPSRGVFLEGQRLVPAKSFNDVIKCVESGNVVRHTASTKMNNRSSRSHAIIMVLLKEERMMTTKNQTSIRTAGKSSRMNLVDLAGSERVSQSEVEGTRFTEATHINLSLSTLGRVIDILADMATKGNKTRYTTAPFRDAKLTFILKDSLGGNSKTMMVAAVSPSALNYEETLGTLRYASRARDIVNVAKVNEDPRARRIRQLEDEVSEMRRALAGADPSYVAQLEEKIALIESEAQNRAADLQALEKEREANQLRERMLKATEAERSELQMQADVLKQQVADSRRQAAEMLEQNLRLKEEQAKRERKLLEDVERAQEAVRLKEETLAQAKRDLARERTEREKAMRFIQHYKEKLEDALFHSERSAAERIALEEANTTLNLKLKELEEEQAQYVNGLVKKLEDCENQAALSPARYVLQIGESETRHEMMVAHVMEREHLLQEYYVKPLRFAMAERLPGKEPIKDDSEMISIGGITRSSPAVSEPPSDNHRGKVCEDLARVFRVRADMQAARGALMAAHPSTMEGRQGSLDQPNRHADPTQEHLELEPGVFDVPEAMTKVDQADEGYYQCVEMIKSQAEVLQKTQHELEELIERFFTESVSVETEEQAMAARLSDVELARDAFEIKENELQMLNERLEECTQQRQAAIRNLERQLKGMLQGKFEVRLFVPGDRDADIFHERELQMGDSCTPMGTEPIGWSPDATRRTDLPNSPNTRAPLLSQEQESGASLDMSAIKRSILDSFPVSARMADLLNKTIH
ncbi:unnamed protein product [Phytomonas sp. EM1]|nr:unnamed protein product [Phytomonas sp. EM1]|eukprot:CCW64265.1 unnamed protein product [Phytomonas sp. isolate EM1]